MNESTKSLYCQLAECERLLSKCSNYIHNKELKDEIIYYFALDDRTIKTEQ